VGLVVNVNKIKDRVLQINQAPLPLLTTITPWITNAIPRMIAPIDRNDALSALV
jgi:hypothetical protein